MRAGGSSPQELRLCPWTDSGYRFFMNIHVVELPDETDTWAKARAEAEGFLTLSDYMAHLVQQQKDIETLRGKLMLGMEGDAISFEEMSARLRARLEAGRR